MLRDIQRVAIINRGEPAMRFTRGVRDYNRTHQSRIRSVVFLTAPDRIASKPPQWRWMPDGVLLWDDPARPAAQRNLEVMDPHTGAVRPFVDTPVAMSSLLAVLGPEKAPRRIPLPSDFGGKGPRCVFSMEKEIVALDVPTSSFVRVTSNGEEEKCVRISPDGQRVAYVRGSDLYVSTIEGPKEVRLTRDGSDSLLNGTLSGSTGRSSTAGATWATGGLPTPAPSFSAA